MRRWLHHHGLALYIHGIFTAPHVSTASCILYLVSCISQASEIAKAKWETDERARLAPIVRYASVMRHAEPRLCCCMGSSTTQVLLFQTPAVHCCERCFFAFAFWRFKPPKLFPTLSELHKSGIRRGVVLFSSSLLRLFCAKFYFQVPHFQ